MRRVACAAAAACLLCAPVVLAFFSGGYFAQPRLVAAIVIWALLVVLALTGPAPVPRGRGGVVAVAGMAWLTVVTAASLGWAPLGGPAAEALQRLLLYLGALLLALGALREPRLRRPVEPVLAAGATLVVGYGLAGRLLPGIVDLARSRSAGGRLEQPLTYWNAMGLLAAIGLVLCARLAGDRSRPRAMRVAAAAAAAPLGAGTYLSYSRGAIAVGLLGLGILVAAAPERAQVRASALALVTALAATGVAAAFPGVASLEGAHPIRDGALALVGLVAIAGAAAGLMARWSRMASDSPLRRPHRVTVAITAATALVAAGLVVAGVGERPTARELAAGAGAQRLTTASSNRYEYWRVGLDAFAGEPLLGVGAGGFRVEWLRERRISETVKDTHSLEVELAAELGLLGLLGLAALVGGVAVAGRTALRRDRMVAAGPIAVLVAWILHASIDWDWQLPAVTLPAVVLAGMVLALAEP